MLVAVLICCLLIGCAKLIRTEHEIVPVEIVDAYWHMAYMTPVRIGEITLVQYHPATYQVTVEYGGVQYVISGCDIWEQYKGMVSFIVPASLEINTYDDGTVKHSINIIGG